MDKSTNEEHLSRPLQTNNIHFKNVVTFLTHYNITIFNLIEKKTKNSVSRSKVLTTTVLCKLLFNGVPTKLEVRIFKLKGITIKERHFTEVDYLLTVKPNFSTFGYNIEISRQEPLNNFTPTDSIRDVLGFNSSTIFEEDNLPLNPVDIISFDKVFPETDIGQGITFKGNKTGQIQNLQ